MLITSLLPANRAFILSRRDWPNLLIASFSLVIKSALMFSRASFAASVTTSLDSSMFLIFTDVVSNQVLPFLLNQYLWYVSGDQSLLYGSFLRKLVIYKNRK